MKQSGVTLIELMVVAEHRRHPAGYWHSRLCRPDSHKPLVQLNQRANFFSALARSEAIKRNARAVLCPSADGSSCEASGGWHRVGWCSTTSTTMPFWTRRNR